MALILGALMIQGIQPGTAADHRARGLVLGPDRQLLDRQRAAGGAERAADRRLGEAAARAVPLPVSVGAVLHRGRRLQHAATTCSRLARCWLSASSARCSPRWISTSRRSLLGFVLGPLVEENFRRALLLSRGDMAVFVHAPDQRRLRHRQRAADFVARVLLGARAAARRRRRPRSPGAGIAAGLQRAARWLTQHHAAAWSHRPSTIASRGASTERRNASTSPRLSASPSCARVALSSTGFRNTRPAV